MSGVRVDALTLHQRSRTLEVGFDTGEVFHLPCEYLRINSPSAEVQGHHPSQRVLVSGKRLVNVIGIDPVGQYGVRLRFDDGHDTGIYTWDTLYRLGKEQAEAWPRYLRALEEKGLERG